MPPHPAPRAVSHTRLVGSFNALIEPREPVIKANNRTGPDKAEVQGGTLSEYQSASENALNISAVPDNYLIEAITYPLDLGGW